jgi:predicted transcriptional regulator
MAGRPITKAANAALEKLGIDALCEKIGEGMTTAEIAKAAGVSRPILSAFLNRAEHADSYRRARETRAANHAERIEQLANEVEAGTIDTNAARVSIDARKWVASRLDAGRWGDSKAPLVNIQLTDLHLGSLRRVAPEAIEVIDDSSD